MKLKFSKLFETTLIIGLALSTGSQVNWFKTPTTSFLAPFGCSTVIVGRECVGTIISGTGNVNQSGGSIRDHLLSVRI